MCIANEQRRIGKAAMGQSLVVSFVVRPVGSVIGFEIEDCALDQPGLKNRLTRVFRGVRFPRVAGSSCPITLPIKLRRD